MISLAETSGEPLGTLQSTLIGLDEVRRKRFHQNKRYLSLEAVMALLRSWSPLREMEEFRRNIDDLLEHLRGRIVYPSGGRSGLRPDVGAFMSRVRG